MFTLIKRELEDNSAYLLGAASFACAAIGPWLSLVFRKDEVARIMVVHPLNFFFIIIALFGFCGLGVTQMSTDKNRRISSFLSTQATTRQRILLARIIAGTLIILIFLVPLIITAAFLLRFNELELIEQDMLTFPYRKLLFEISLGIFLLSFACYCIGLQTGWNQSKLAPTLGGLALACIFIPIFLIKGFGLEITVILILFIAASLVRVWKKFMTTAL